MVPRINKILQTALDSIAASNPEPDFADVAGDKFTAPTTDDSELREVEDTKSKE
jgi:hypothetical protein